MIETAVRGALAALEGACAARGEPVQAVTWYSPAEAALQAGLRRRRARDRIFEGWLGAAGAGVLLVAGALAPLATGYPGPWWTAAYAAAMALLALSVAVALRENAAERRYLGLSPRDDAGGHLVLVLGRDRLLKAWYHRGAELRTASLPVDDARAFEVRDGWEVRDRDGRVFAGFGRDGTEARRMIVEALGGARRQA